MTLELNGLAVDCIIGERPEERLRTQRLVLDIALTIGDEAAESDRLADTVDYAALAAAVTDVLVRSRCQMIERAAKVAFDVCLADPKVRAARVKVTKSGAVPGLASAAAVYEGGR